MGPPGKRDNRIVLAAVLATISTVFPGFLIGALSEQVSDDFAISDTRYGWFLGGFFLAAALGSRVTGKVVQRVGPRKQMMVAISVSIVVQLLISTVVDSFWGLLAAMAVAGLMNAANQTAVNLALTRANLGRLGLAIAVKQSGMPGAAMVSGLAVPAIALTVGWRWAYVLGASMAVAGLVAVALVIDGETPELRTTTAEVVSSKRSLRVAALVGFFLAFGAGTLTAWLVGSGVDAGLGEGAAGLMLSAGAALGIALRLTVGFGIDAMKARPFRMAGYMVLLGAAGLALLGVRSPGVHIVATVVAFVGGWVWPVFTNYGIMRTNQQAAGAASGVTQTGVYVGVFLAPVLTGWMIDTVGYSVMWLVVAGFMVAGSVAALTVADDF